MFRLICKTLTLLEQQRSIGLNFSYVRYYVKPLASLNSISKPSDEQQALTVSFLTNSCGLSLDKAISASKMVNIQNTEKPNSVIQLLTSRGFTKSQIAALISRHPPLLLADSDKNLKPKFDYFKSVGLLSDDLSRFLCWNINILRRSLKNQIMPTFDFLRSVVKTNENLVYALSRSIRVVDCNIEKQLVPNVKTLRANGVPEPLIAKLIMLQPNSLICRVDLFKNLVDAVKEMGFEPTSMSFVLAVRSMSVLKKSAWEKKKVTLMSFGWSEDEFRLAFKRQPMIMVCSEKKIRKLMDFFLKKIRLKPSDIVRCPNLLLVSLEKRISPRWSVLQVLMSKKLLKKDVDVIWALNAKKQDFEKKFVTSFIDDPEVMMAYQDGLGVQAVVVDGGGTELSKM